MDTDIRDAIERSFGEGPAHPDTDELLTRGRGTLRRRRLAEAASLAAVAVVAVTVTALAAGGRTDGAAPDPVAPTSTATTSATRAADPTHAPQPRPTFPPASGTDPIPDDHLTMDRAIQALPDGLHVSTRVTVLKVVDDPWGYRSDGAWSVAVAYRDPKGVVRWWAGYTEKDGGGSSAEIPKRYAHMDFSSWVAAQDNGIDYARGKGATPPTPPEGGWPGRVRIDLVRFAAAGTERLLPLDAVTLLEQRTHPDLPDSWARSGDRSAAAEVRFEGRRFYVLARSTPDGKPQFIAVRASKGGATLDDFLDLARSRYAEGGGGLL